MAGRTGERSAERTGSPLKIAGVNKHYGGVAAVDDFSVEISAGDLMALIGPNGAGKTTLLQIVCGLVEPDSGALALGKLDLTRLSPEQIAAHGVARVYQTSRVFPALTIWDSVRVSGIPYLIGGGRYGRLMNPLVELFEALFACGRICRRLEDIDERAEEVLRLFGDRLWPRRTEPARNMSFANRRRLDLARALVADPDVLLLDEPTAGMNPTETEELIDLLMVIHRQRPWMTILVVEHKMDVVRQLARSLVVMETGRLLAQGPPEEVLEDPRVVEAYLGRGGSSG